MPVIDMWDGWNASERVGLLISLVALPIAIFAFYLPEKRARRNDREEFEQRIDSFLETRATLYLPTIIERIATTSIHATVAAHIERISRVGDRLDELEASAATYADKINQTDRISDRLDRVESAVTTLNPLVEHIQAELRLKERLERMSLPAFDQDWCERASHWCAQTDSPQRNHEIKALTREVVERYRWAIADAAIAFPPKFVGPTWPKTLPEIMELANATIDSHPNASAEERFHINLYVQCVKSISNCVCVPLHPEDKCMALATVDPTQFPDEIVGLCRRVVTTYISQLVEPYWHDPR